MLRNATWVGVYGLAQISVTKMCGPILLVLSGGGGVQFPEKKCYVTLEWPLNISSLDKKCYRICIFNKMHLTCTTDFNIILVNYLLYRQKVDCENTHFGDEVLMLQLHQVAALS